ncbi:MAG: permease-like cell division protein FtsX [Patescibacteria group bacterium]
MLSKITLGRIFKHGFLNLWRNQWLSVAAISVMIITLLVISALLVVNQLAALSSQNLQSRVDISVFFNSDVSEQRLKEIEDEFSQYEEVGSVQYVSAEESLSVFRERHKDDPVIQQTLESLGENPLLPLLIISAKELNQYPIINQKIERSRFQPLINHLDYKDAQPLIEKLQRITAGIRNIGISATIVFGLIAILVMFNTLRLTIFSRKEEIEIMRLVGAPNSYIRGPFLIEGVLYGVIATVFATILFYPALKLSTPWISGFFGLDLSVSSYFNHEFWKITVVQAISGIVLGVISSAIATRKHLQI